MAMLKCPECGREVSDKSKQCVYCGSPIDSVERSEINNPSVENTNNNTMSASPAMEDLSNIPPEDDALQNAFPPLGQADVPISNGSPKKKLPLKTVIPCAAVLLVVLVVVFTAVRSSHKKADQYQRAARYQIRGEYEDAIELYQELGGYEDAKDCASYCEALILLNGGDYEGAYDILSDIPEYEGTQGVLKQIYYETRFFEGINDLKKYLKNPDSLTVKNVEFHYYTEDEAEENNPTIDAPVCIIMESAQNGFGGFSSGYALLSYNKDNNSYQYVGSVDSLNEDDYDLTDTDEMYDWLLCSVIQDHREHPEIEDAVDQDRIEEIISSGRFSNIKSIEALTIDAFADALFTDPVKASVGSTEEA